MNRFWAISAAGFAWIAAATVVQPPQPGMYPDHFFPEISVVCWTAVCLSVALAGRARAVDRNWRSSAGLRWAFGAAALLLVPAALGWSSFGLGPLGASLLLASAAFHRASLGMLVVGLFALLTAGSIEAALSVLSQSDWAARNPLVSELAFKLHARGRAAMQYDCGRYDPELLYTLRPGECRFANPEFETALRINSLGVRDDETSLQAPEAVVLGDSFAAGWGVEQDQTDAQVFEQASGRRTLNAGVSSYAPPRALTLLRRVDRSRLRRVFLQVCNNDVDENRAFVASGFELPPAPESRWRIVNEDYRLLRRRWPGRLSAYVARTALFNVFSPLRRRPADPPAAGAGPPPSAAADIVSILEHFADELAGLDVVVFGLNGRGLPAKPLIADLEQRFQSNPALAGMVRTVDVDAVLTPDDFLLRDRHLNAAGHRKIGLLLADVAEQ